MFQEGGGGYFLVSLAQKTISNLLFEKRSKFHISYIVVDIIPHLGTFIRHILKPYIFLGRI